jgi:hypothetical protein
MFLFLVFLPFVFSALYFTVLLFSLSDSPSTNTPLAPTHHIYHNVKPNLTIAASSHAPTYFTPPRQLVNRRVGAEHVEGERGLQHAVPQPLQALVVEPFTRLFRRQRQPQ